ncbi:MAG: DivIVA domain-containing protein [Candidatus Tectomicrobia bacterium]|uniref:DivIVA domain-containing protein n=1 Tax=Tectimicrobiota bacterium TaxID=2528274 RepID=A0A932HYQ7_UNCTE|nr:DivIVA domain-containing protein [Candidatus Tectomicrobia bacterium]
MRMTGEDIRRQEFPIRLRGYNRLDVDAFLHAAADAVDELMRRNEELDGRCAELTAQVQALKEREETLQRALVAVNDLREEAGRRAQEIRQQAEREAERMAEEAEEAARRVREDAESEVVRMREEAEALLHRQGKMVRSMLDTIRAQLRLAEQEDERLGHDLARLEGREGGKVISISKAEGDRP